MNITVPAYDATGNKKVPTPLSIGDELDWKRNGTAGSFRCRVLAISVTNGGRNNIRVLVLAHDGVPRNFARWITDRGISRVYP